MAQVSNAPIAPFPTDAPTPASLYGETAFTDALREAVRAANLAPLSTSDYNLLCAARRIAEVGEIG